MTRFALVVMALILGAVLFFTIGYNEGYRRGKNDAVQQVIRARRKCTEEEMKATCQSIKAFNALLRKRWPEVAGEFVDGGDVCIWTSGAPQTEKDK